VKKLLLVVLCMLCAGFLATISAQVPATPVTYSYTYAGYAAPIFVDDADVVTFVTITVPRAFIVQKVTASVQIDYPEVGDLNVYMYSPIWTRVKLLERNCGSLRNVDTTFDDSAQSRYSEFCPSEAGRGPFRANEPLSNFNGQSALGVWRLAVENNGSDDRAGFVVGFTVSITGLSQPVAVVAPDGVRSSAAPLELDQPIAPGQLISIFGYNLGPSGGMSSNEPYWPTWIDGTNVKVNDMEAPLRYISFYRIDAQVPMGLDVSRNATVTVFRNSVSTTPVEVMTAAVAPTVYTTNRLGAGQADALNADGSTNDADHPAEAGSLITIHATGLGLTQPPATEGQPVSGSVEFNTVAPVSALIGGMQAQVRKSVLLPGTNALYGVQLMVPRGLRPGQVDVVIGAGQKLSQNGVYIHVR
jgi:uncharacterized protein (TIGR03437 family)